MAKTTFCWKYEMLGILYLRARMSASIWHKFGICSVAKLMSNNLIMKFLIAPSLSFLCQHSMRKQGQEAASTSNREDDGRTDKQKPQLPLLPLSLSLPPHPAVVTPLHSTHSLPSHSVSCEMDKSSDRHESVSCFFIRFLARLLIQNGFIG